MLERWLRDELSIYSKVLADVISSSKEDLKREQRIRLKDMKMRVDRTIMRIVSPSDDRCPCCGQHLG